MAPTMLKYWRPLLVAFSMLLMSGCAHRLIPGTSIPDNADTQAIYRIVQSYQVALEALDADAVLKLVSPRFYENNGNTDPNDDYDFNGLKAHLESDFQKTKRMFVNFRIDAIEVDENAGYAELFFEIRALNTYPAGERWDTARDRTRLQMVRENDAAPWKIIRGL